MSENNQPKEQCLSPRKALNKAYLKQKPERNKIEVFKVNLMRLLGNISEIEREENQKNHVRDFLRDTYYRETNEINTKNSIDLVIHLGRNATDPVGVILEAKRPSNKVEMISKENLNAKAMQELVLYYLRERFLERNVELKNLVVTNINEWFIFDASTFETFFGSNKDLIRVFREFSNGSLPGKTTDFFYTEIASKFISDVKEQIAYTYFNVSEYQQALSIGANADDSKLIALYKLLSPEHLLKEPFANDSNTLDRHFYSELLHIIGLSEVTIGAKTLIERKPNGTRNHASLLESAIFQIEGLDDERQLFSDALELVITWVNRILFLKLLEGQQLNYNRRNHEYAFLNSDNIPSYDDLNTLFFKVLAVNYRDRHEQVKERFKRVPYLNSSLFDKAEIESKHFPINGISDGELPLFPETVLKDSSGRRKTGNIRTLAYLFEFLDSYDFSSEGTEEIQEENKTLINASVLGLIFEKINGYKDGSFFTPGFVTMFMCREVIRKAVVQKFNERFSWNAESISDVYNGLRIGDRGIANDIINSIRVCDPAVGSGHFLVSALNEILSIKAELGILCDVDGKRLKEYQVIVEDDELILTDEDGAIFAYNPALAESRRVQETLFFEKQTIIENCLFGVDININSVKICRLRLWIELLKSAFYTKESQFSELETLPNLDINIRCGNSLVSRFDLDVDIKEELAKIKLTVKDYRQSVHRYKNASNKAEKRELEVLIEEIKGKFQTEVQNNDRRLVYKRKLLVELSILGQGELFGLSESEELARIQEKSRIADNISRIDEEINAIRNNKVYEDSFEWRLEFPEVLNDDGDFVGFDVVIGNPPYMRVQEIQVSQPLAKDYYDSKYKNAKAAYDLANIFFELAVNISSLRSCNAFILPHKFLNSGSASVFRDYLIEGTFIDKITHFGANMVFEDADTYTCISQFSKMSNNGFLFYRFPFRSKIAELMRSPLNYREITHEMIAKASTLYGKNQWILFDSETSFGLFEKIYSGKVSLESKLDGIFVGLQTSKDELFVVRGSPRGSNLFVHVSISNRDYEVESDLFKPFLQGRDVLRYGHLTTDKYVFFPYEISDGESKVLTESEISSRFPLTYIYLKDHEQDFRSRENGRAGQSANWYSHGRENNLAKFEQLKLSSMEICTNHPNVTINDQHFYHTTKVYSWIKKKTTKESYEFFLALANSPLLWWFLKNTGDTLQGDARTLKTNYLYPFPVPPVIQRSDDERIKVIVRQILDSKKESPSVPTDILEAEVNRCIYQIYELSEDEIRAVEQA